MIRDIADKLATRLRAVGVPTQVFIGPEPHQTTTGARERIIIEHDRDGRETFSAPRGPRQNPKHVHSGNPPFKVTIYAQSVKAGALPFEHEERALRLRRHVVVALDGACRGDLQVSWQPIGGAFVRPTDLDASAKLPGAVYALTFTAEEAFSAGVTFAGESAPEVDLGSDVSITNRTDVRLANGPENAPVQTGCGG